MTKKHLFYERAYIMNIEIANRLVNLRKEKGLSQEQLAEKIGVSRQAVSKWERSEASPDTDNIILLAKLYNVSLDELLRTDDEIVPPEEEPEANGFEQAEPDETEEASAETEENTDGYYKESPNGDKVHIGLDGIHVEDRDGDRVHIGLGGIHVEENGGDSVHIGPGGIFVNEKKYDKDGFKNWHHHENHNKFAVPIVMLSIIGFLCGGIFLPDGWNVSWLFLYAIPVLCSLESAIRKRNPSDFAYPVFAAFIFCFAGVFYGLWHPAWAIFTTIPLYYIACDMAKGKSVVHYVYPVIIAMLYIFLGFMFNLWHPAWILFLTIPIYYWLVAFFKKN